MINTSVHTPVNIKVLNIGQVTLEQFMLIFIIYRLTMPFLIYKLVRELFLFYNYWHVFRVRFLSRGLYIAQHIDSKLLTHYGRHRLKTTALFSHTHHSEPELYIILHTILYYVKVNYTHGQHGNMTHTNEYPTDNSQYLK